MSNTEKGVLMTIEDAFQRQGWRLERTSRWIAVKDDRAQFRKIFGTDRVGKLIGANFCVTLTDLKVDAHRLILNLGRSVEYVASTSGRGAEYPGFEHSQVPAPVLLTFAEQLRREVDAWIQK